MNVGIYGMGRFGCLWSSLISLIDSVTSVFAYDLRSDIDVPDKVILCKTREELFKADVVFFCVPISKFEAVLRDCATYMHPGQLIADTCSVKVYPAQQMQRWVPKECPLLATHPLFGPDTMRCDDKTMVLYPLRDAEEHSAKWGKAFQKLGIHTITMDPETHDYQIAYTQGITHLIARALISDRQEERYISSRSYKLIMEIMDQTCNDSLELFMDMHRYNPYAKEARDEFQQSLNAAMQLIDNRKEQSI